MPMNRSGLPEDRASSVMDIWLVLEANMTEGPQIPLRSRKSFFFRLLILDDGFDDQVGLSGHLLNIRGGRDPRQGLLGIPLRQLASLNTASRNLLILDRAFQDIFESVSSSEVTIPLPHRREQSRVP